MVEDVGENMEVKVLSQMVCVENTFKRNEAKRDEMSHRCERVLVNASKGEIRGQGRSSPGRERSRYLQTSSS